MIEQYSKYNEQQIKSLLKNDKADVRFAAAYVVGEKKVPLPREMIELLSDSSTAVQQASRRSLILLACQATGPKKPCDQLTRQVNSLIKYGPEPTTKKSLITRAVNKWNAWWDDNDPQLLKLVNANRSPEEKSTSSAANQKNEKAASNSAPAAEPPDPEQAASAKLNLAKMLAKDGLEKKARVRYEEILQQYPKTKAAREARKLLDRKQEQDASSAGAKK
jgi:hypothetical protein